MERSSALTRARRTFIILAGAAGIWGAVAAPAIAGWTRPVEVSAPTSLEILGSQVASSPSGAAAVSFNEVNLDAQATAGAFVALASPHGAFHSAQAVPGAQEILAMAYAGSTLELLTASGPTGQPCCSTVQVIRLGEGSGFGAPQTIVTGAGGGTTGRLVPLSNGRILAVIAAPERLWVTEARGAGRFGPPRGLTQVGSAPAAVAVTGTPMGGSAIMWTQGAGQNVFGASAGPGATPSRRRTLLTVPAGHAVDGLQLVSGPAGLTVAWTESWNNASGAYHSQVMASDLAGLGDALRPRALSRGAEVASGLALAGDGNGNEVATWEVCTSASPACQLQSRVREQPATSRSSKKGAGGGKNGKAKRAPVRWFGPVSAQGRIDPGESPELTIGTGGEALLGWISGGRVVLASMARVAARGSAAARFGPPRAISGGLADDLAVGFGVGGDAVAAWTQGTFAPDVFASVMR